MNSNTDKNRAHSLEKRMRISRAEVGFCVMTLLLILLVPPATGQEQTRGKGSGVPATSTPGDRVLYLDYALRTERWLRRQAVTTAAGKIWRSPDERDDHPITNGNLYYGSSGIILFYLELYQQTGTRRFLEEAEDGAGYLMAAVPAELFFQEDLNALELFPSLNQPAQGGLPVYTATNGLAHPDQVSLYWGVSGIGFTLGEMYRVTGKQEYRRAALDIVDLMLRDHHVDEFGASWGSTPELQIGDAGAGLFLLYAARELAHPKAEKLAREIGESLLEAALQSEPGLMWSTQRVYGTNYPNFAHGSAGIGYFLTTLHQQTGDDRFITGARGVGRYLVKIADENGLIAHHLPDDEGLRYYGWCHGPAGTNRLFEKLSRDSSPQEQLADSKNGPASTPAPLWSHFIERSNHAVIEAGLLERKPEGFWQNFGQCCGSAGIADYFLDQYVKTRNPEYLAFAQAMSDDIIRHASDTEDVLSWNHAEHRSTPEFTQSLTGYMQGAAGIGMHFLRMHALVNQRSVSIRLLDDRL
jgi:hypothetical protein